MACSATFRQRLGCNRRLGRLVEKTAGRMHCRFALRDDEPHEINNDITHNLYRHRYSGGRLGHIDPVLLRLFKGH